jgi:hypothetical protein
MGGKQHAQLIMMENTESGNSYYPSTFNPENHYWHLNSEKNMFPTEENNASSMVRW